MSFADMPFNHTADEAFKAFIKPMSKPLQPAKEGQASGNEGVSRANLAANRTRNNYLQAQIETASPTRLIVMLYEGAIRFCYLGIEAMNAKLNALIDREVGDDVGQMLPGNVDGGWVVTDAVYDV